MVVLSVAVMAVVVGQMAGVRVAKKRKFAPFQGLPPKWDEWPPCRGSFFVSLKLPQVTSVALVSFQGPVSPMCWPQFIQ